MDKLLRSRCRQGEGRGGSIGSVPPVPALHWFATKTWPVQILSLCSSVHCKATHLRIPVSELHTGRTRKRELSVRRLQTKWGLPPHRWNGQLVESNACFVCTGRLPGRRANSWWKEAPYRCRGAFEKSGRWLATLLLSSQP